MIENKVEDQDQKQQMVMNVDIQEYDTSHSIGDFVKKYYPHRLMYDMEKKNQYDKQNKNDQQMM